MIYSTPSWHIVGSPEIFTVIQVIEKHTREYIIAQIYFLSTSHHTASPPAPQEDSDPLTLGLAV